MSTYFTINTCDAGYKEETRLRVLVNQSPQNGAIFDDYREPRSLAQREELLAFHLRFVIHHMRTEQGKEHWLEIKEISSRGDGVARIEGFVVFVPQTKPGDKVKVKINPVGPRFATGEIAQ